MNICDIYKRNPVEFLQLKKKPNVFLNAAKHNIFSGLDKITKVPLFKNGSAVRYSYVGKEAELIERRRKDCFKLDSDEEEDDYMGDDYSPT